MKSFMNLFIVIGKSIILLSGFNSGYSQESDFYSKENIRYKSFEEGPVVKNIVENKTVRIIYLVPSDSVENTDYTLGLQNTARHIQLWYYQQLGKTFALHDPIVEVYKTPHEGTWYSTNSNGDLFVQFWNNILDDGFALTDAQFNDPNNIYAFYIDAHPICGQCGGCGTSGVLAIGANDLRGIVDKPWVSICPGETYTFKPCRFVGGLGHELGHAFGLPHPPGCETSDDGCDYGSIMWTGFYDYPDCYFNQTEKQSLLENPFIQYDSLDIEDLFNCDKLLDNIVTDFDNVRSDQEQIVYNYPNPFTNSTTFYLNIQSKLRFTLEIYDLFGRKLVSLMDDELSAGKYSIPWDASNLGANIYIYKYRIGNKTICKQAVKIR
jgi:predicted Zn-dependent protease